jgi:hypothetical protein
VLQALTGAGVPAEQGRRAEVQAFERRAWMHDLSAAAKRLQDLGMPLVI